MWHAGNEINLKCIFFYGLITSFSSTHKLSAVAYETQFGKPWFSACGELIQKSDLKWLKPKRFMIRKV